MSPAELILIGKSGCEDVGKPPMQADPDIAFQMRVSIRIIQAEKRIADLERDLESYRRIIGRITTRFAVDGRPLPTEADDAK